MRIRTETDDPFVRFMTNASNLSIQCITYRLNYYFFFFFAYLSCPNEFIDFNYSEIASEPGCQLKSTLI